MIAVCSLESMFTITGPAFVLIVEILEGIIYVGDSIALPMGVHPNLTGHGKRRRLEVAHAH
jgi:hypothetical protein